MKNKLTFLFALGAAAAFAETVSVKSPDGLNEIALDTDGGLSYSVLRSGKTLIAPTPLSITIEGKGTLGAAGAVVESKGSRAVKGTLATPIYKKSSRSEDANENAELARCAQASPPYAFRDAEKKLIQTRIRRLRWWRP